MAELATHSAPARRPESARQHAPELAQRALAGDAPSRPDGLQPTCAGALPSMRPGVCPGNGWVSRWINFSANPARELIADRLFESLVDFIAQVRGAVFDRVDAIAGVSQKAVARPCVIPANRDTRARVLRAARDRCRVSVAVQRDRGFHLFLPCRANPDRVNIVIRRNTKFNYFRFCAAIGAETVNGDGNE